jgi:hypothetical protein
MKKLLLFVFLLTIVPASRANSDPPTWLDVTNLPSGPSAVPGCASDAGPAINNAISLASAPGTVIFFPTGCYLINTRIVDNRGSVHGGITYLGYGRVELQAGNSLTGSIILFGGETPSTNTVDRRRISGIYFECSPPSGTQPSIDGVDLDGMINSVFDDVEIRDCPNTGLNTVGTNGNNWQNVFDAGVIVAYSNGGNGAYLGPGANNWVFKGSKISSMATASTGVGIDFEGSGNACVGCAIQGWRIGMLMANNSSGSSIPRGGLEIDGGYFEANSQYDIRIGYAGQATSNGAGVSIHGAYFNGQGITPNCVEVEWADGFTISGNHFHGCLTHNVRALADDTEQGADNGFVGPNTITCQSPCTLATDQLLGKNITAINGGQITTPFYATTGNCSSSASPAACGSASSGSVVVAAGATTVVVDTTAVTANSQILLTFDSSLGSKLGVTCNTTPVSPSVSARSAGTSFTISLGSAPATNPACYSYTILN